MATGKVDSTRKVYASSICLDGRSNVPGGSEIFTFTDVEPGKYLYTQNYIGGLQVFYSDFGYTTSGDIVTVTEKKNITFVAPASGSSFYRMQGFLHKLN